MIKVFIVDDHEIIREGLKKILKEESDFVVVAEAQDGVEALEKIQHTDCDIMLLDMNMPGRSGIDLLSDLKIVKPQLHILVLSIHPEDKFALRTLKAGASGYLCKDTALDELVIAIRKIHSKGRYLSTTLAEQLAFDVVPDKDQLPHESLSNRELEIMFLLAEGKKVKTIAKELTLSVSTVFTYRVRIFEKLKLKNDVELTHYAINNKLIE
ncbi:MAG: response regulator transcription factor [Paludibacter sp.]|jgi:two-component system, NarL family, invasion response regulator UvrY|nr:response regulator transcription factor [Paludibacter sp.]